MIAVLETLVMEEAAMVVVNFDIELITRAKV